MSSRKILLLKIAVWIGCFVPLGRLLYKGWTGGLGANPIEFITLSTGTWTLIFLLATLSITPLRKLTGQSWLIRIRRLIGLFAFFYASLHFTTYVWLDKFFEFQEMVEDVMKRRFITVGFLAFTLLVPLAMTSTTWAVRKLGGKNWQRLHRLIYLSAVAGVIHFWWKVKADVREPAIYAAILGGLLLLRLAITAREKYRKPSPRLKSGPVRHPGTQPAGGPD